MIDYKNPFEYEEANKFSDEEIIELFIEDYNFSRFVRSRRNIFLVGERGSGKTMTLLYNSFPVQLLKKQKEGKEIDARLISVYIPCRTVLILRKEHELLENFPASVISEHFLAISIIYEIAHNLSLYTNILENADIDQIVEEISFVLGIDLPKDSCNVFEALKTAIQRENVKAQKAINNNKPDAFYDNTISFSSSVVPLILCLKKIPKLKDSHFSLMVDDAQSLNSHQIKILNSWISYRDNSAFSFKVATTKVDQPSQITASGGSILEGHDFTMVDMELPYQNEFSDFGKLARQIIKRRLEKIEVDKSPDEFFAINPQFEKDIKKCEDIVRREAEKKYPGGTPKQIGDHIYKQARAVYFRERPAKANLPGYSGFEILVHLSTGVIRNLLEPCYWMYDEVKSNQKNGTVITEIPSKTQSKIILERSEKKWEWINKGLDKAIDGCSKKQAEQIYNLFDNLAVHFKKRLLNHKSEPRAITFTISEIKHPNYSDILDLLTIARKAQILYTYTSPAKDSGKRETYYVPNRILWPIRGLDPVGQHARVSLKTSVLWAAAENNQKIPFNESTDSTSEQLRLSFPNG